MSVRFALSKRHLARTTSIAAAGVLIVALCASCAKYSGGSNSSGGSSGSGTSGSSGASGNSTQTTTAGTVQKGGTVTVAQYSGQPPNYILPIEPGNDSTATNAQISGLLWKGLYRLAPVQPVIDYAQSIGNKPVFSDGNKTVTITMKHYLWSDGKPVTARDVQFGFNMIRAMGPIWGGYVTGGFPTSVKSLDVLGPYEFQLHLVTAAAPAWFTDDQLLDLLPLPQHAWDKTAASGKVGNYDLTASGAKAVEGFLNKESEQSSSYTSNPLWQVVDGAFKMSSYGGASSPTDFVPNPKYSGHHAIISKLELVPYTTTASEFNALRSGPSTLSYGQLDSSDIPQLRTVESEGYTNEEVYSWHINYINLNFTNPKLAPLFNQLYIRQALQHLIDQDTDIKAFLAGLGSPIYGPTPAYPRSNPFTSSDEKTALYPYSVNAAISLLKAHGWTVNPGHTDVCAKGGAGGCGAGIATGTKLSIPLLTGTETDSMIQMAQNFESDAAKAGVSLTLHEEPFNTVLGIMNICKKSNPSSQTCQWGLGTYGGDGEDIFPDSEDFFGPGTAGGFNSGGYVSVPLDKIMTKVIHDTDAVTYYHQYANYVAQQLPLLWFPDPFQVNDYEVASNLHVAAGGVPFNSEFGGWSPEYWYFSKS